MSSIMNEIFISYGATMYRTIQKPTTFNELLWYAYHNLGIEVQVEAVFNHYGTRKEITLTNSNYKNMTSYSRVCFRAVEMPSLEAVVDQATKEEEDALKVRPSIDTEQHSLLLLTAIPRLLRRASGIPKTFRGVESRWRRIWDGNSSCQGREELG